MRQTISKFNFFSCFAALLVLSGCGEKFSDDEFLFDPPEHYDALIESGWTNFQNGMYQEAVDAFMGASERNAVEPGVYLGLGWSYARNLELIKGENNLQKAIAFANFDSLNSTVITVESLAGIGLIKLATANYTECISYIDQLLEADDSFAFSKDLSINSQSLKISKAKSHYYLGEIEKSYLALQDLGIEIDGVQVVSGTGTVKHGEYYQDIDGSDSWGSGEPLDDRNGNGIWDNNNTTSLGEVLVSVNPSHSLVSGTAIRSDGINYTILKTYEGTNWLLIAGNPIVAENHMVEADYIFTEDYSEFLNKLLGSITNY
jgi:tetratricopeptide (TPR) repeat protein